MNWCSQETRLFLSTAGHCRGHPLLVSSSWSAIQIRRKVEFFLFWNKNREGAAQGLICLMCLWLCICIFICVFCFASTRWWVLWEIRDYSGPPCVCDTAFANTCLLLCICDSVFVYLSLAARGGESFGKSRITRGLRREENSDQLYNNLQMRAFAQPLSSCIA